MHAEARRLAAVRADVGDRFEVVVGDKADAIDGILSLLQGKG